MKEPGKLADSDIPFYNSSVLKATLIFNPRAGQMTLASRMELVAGSWQSRGWQVNVCPTERPGHARELARRAAAEGEQLVLAAGGDGTMGQVADGLAGSETIMGVLPVGTTNSFAHELRLPRASLLAPHKLLQASEALAQGRVQRIDLGYVTHSDAEEGHHWLLWVGVGADSFLVANIEPRPTWSKRLGATGYSVQALPLLYQLPSVHARIQVDGQQVERETLLIVISNCRLYAGGMIPLNRNAKLDDGVFEVWVFSAGRLERNLPPSLRAARMARYLAAARIGQHELDPGIFHLTGRSVTIEAQPPIPFQTDGEKAGISPLRCEIRPGALRLLTPATTPAGLFTQPGVAFSPVV